MANKIQVRRGNQADLPTLDAGEPGWTLDTERLYIGNPAGSGNVLIVASGGVVGKVGTPVANQVTFWANGDDVTGAAEFVWDDTLKKLQVDNVELPVGGLLYLGPSTNNTHLQGAGASQVNLTVANTLAMRWFPTNIVAHQRLIGFSAPLTLGAAATTSHALTADDVLVGGDLEVDGLSYLDGDAVCELVTGSDPSARLTLDSAGAQLSYSTTDWRVVAGRAEADTGTLIGWFSSTRMVDDGDGSVVWYNAALNDFGLMKFGGTTASYPALKRDGAELYIRLADDSAFGNLMAETLLANSVIRFATSTRLSAPADGKLLLTDSLGTDFGLLQFGGTTSAFPALKRNTHVLHVRRADDSDYSGLRCSFIIADDNIELPSGSNVQWTWNSKIGSLADGDIVLTDWAGTDFGLLQLGGTSASFPALKRLVTELAVRLADDSGYANIIAQAVRASSHHSWINKSRMYSDVDGNIRLTDNATTDFGLLQLGGTTASFPALKRSGAVLQARLADDSGYANFTGAALISQTYIQAQFGSPIRWNGRTNMSSPADGDLLLTNAAQTDFGLLQLGGTASAFPALKRSGAAMRIRLADDSADSSLFVNSLFAGGVMQTTSYYTWTNDSRMYCDADGDIRLTDNTGADFGLLQFGGTGVGYPALKRVGAVLLARLADDSDFASIQVGSVTAVGNLIAGSSNNIQWSGRTRMLSPVDGDVMLRDSAGADFGLLQLGGTTNSFPALGRSGAVLEARLADDSGYANLTGAALISQSYIQAQFGSVIRWNGRTNMSSPADGDLLLTDAALADFGLLQFGGTTAAYPALKRVGNYLAVRLADDSAAATLQAGFLASLGNISAASTNNIQWSGRTRMYSGADGDVRLVNSAETDFGLLQFGGFTAAYPAWKRDGVYLRARLADDSNDTSVKAQNLYATATVYAGDSHHFGWTTRSRIYSDADGDVRLTDSTGADFGLLQFGGTTASYPALKRSGADLLLRLADDSAYAQLQLGGLVVWGNLLGRGDLRADETADIYWLNRSRMQSPSDGNVHFRDNAGTGWAQLSCGPIVANSATGLALYWPAKTQIRCVADGDLLLTDNLGTDFGLLQFGGTGATYPALKRSTTELHARLADDSAYAVFRAASLAAVTGSCSVTSSGQYTWSGSTRILSPSDGTITLTNFAQTDFGLLQFGGTTNAFPALQRSGNALYVRLADDSGFARIWASDVIVYDSSSFIIQNRARIAAPSGDGNIRLTDSAGTDFGLLQLGGTTSSYPALKRSTTELHARTADDTVFVTFRAGSVIASGNVQAGINLVLVEQVSSPSPTVNAGKLYTKSSDSKLYYMNDSGSEFDLISSSGVTGSGNVGELAYWSTGTQLSSDPKFAINTTTGGMLMSICRLTEQGSSPGDTANIGQLFVRSSDSALIYRNDTGSEYNLTLTAGVTGGGATGRPALWTGASTLGDDADFTWDSSNNRLGITSALTIEHDGSDAIVKNTTGLAYYQSSAHRFQSAAAGAADIQIHNDAYYRWQSSGVSLRSAMGSPADGNIALYNSSLNDFDLLQFGGTTSGYPALKRSGAGLVARLADDSGSASFTAGILISTSLAQIANNSYFSWASRSRMYSDADGNIRLSDDASTGFNLLQFGGTTLGFPALKRNGAALQARLADDSANADFSAATITAGGSLISGSHVQVGSGASVVWAPTSSRIYSPANGTLRLTDWAGTSFNLLQFGGTTNAFPALRRSAGPQLDVRAADDSGSASLTCNNFGASGYVQAGAASEIRWQGSTEMSAPADGDLLLTDTLASDFGMLQFGGTTSGFPALQRSGANLLVRLADDTDYSNLYAQQFRVPTSGSFNVTTRLFVSSPVDGNMLVTNSGATDFGLLQFGGTTGAFPALKRVGNSIQVRTADDVGQATFSALTLFIAGRSKLNSAVDGNITIWNNAGTDFGLLQFGGTTSAFPAWKRNTTRLEARLADDSGRTTVTAAAYEASSYFQAGATGYYGWPAKSRIYSDADGNIRLADDAGTDFGLLQLGGTTSSFPALKRNGSSLETRLADDSDRCGLLTGAVTSSSNVQIAPSGSYLWGTRSRLYSDADGNVRLTDNAGADFGLLQLGGTTALFPAIKRSTTRVQVRLADDSAFANLEALNLYAASSVRIGSGTGTYVNLSALAGNTLQLTDNTGTDFSGLLTFGGTTLGYPALKRVSDELQVRLADDSDFADLQVENLTVNGTLSVTGWTFTDVEAGATNYIGWDSRSLMRSPSDGNITLLDNAETDFGMLQFGGTTGAFPALKRSGGSLIVRAADDSAYLDFRADTIEGSGFIVNPASGRLQWTGRSKLTSTADGSLTLSNDAGSSSVEMEVNTVPNNLTIGSSLIVGGDLLTGATTGTVRIGQDGFLFWTNRSRIYADAVGNLRLTDELTNDFNLLQFGGTSLSYPALRRSAARLEAVLADESAYAAFWGSVLHATVELSMEAAGVIDWNTRTTVSSPVDGDLLLTDAAGTDFSMLQLGGTTSAYPAIKRVGSTIVIRRADDLASAPLFASYIAVADWLGWGTNASRMYAAVDGDITLTDSAVADFGLLQFGGTTAAFPALKRTGVNIEARRADDVTRVGLLASNFQADTFYNFPSKTRISAPLDGQLLLTNAAETDFSLLQFGGTTAAFPALKRITNQLYARLADDSGYADIIAKNVLAIDDLRAGPDKRLFWNNRTVMRSPLDGQILLTDDAGTDFDRIFLGGQTASFPAIVRNGADIELRLGDDSARTGLRCGTITQNAATHYIINSGSHLRLGTSAATSHGLTVGDVVVGGALEVDGDCYFDGNVDIAGTLTVGGIGFTDVEAAETGYVGWENRSRMLSPLDGKILLTDNSESDFSMLLFGGTTAAYPALNRSSTTLLVRLADNSDYASLYAESLRAFGFLQSESHLALLEQVSAPSDTLNYGKLYVRQSDNALIYRKDTGTEYDLTQAAGVSGGGSADRVPVWTGASTLGDSGMSWDGTAVMLQIGGTTSAYPAWKRSSASLEARLADDSGRANVLVNALSASGSVTASSTLQWAAKSRMYSDVDGNIRLTDIAGTDFGLLQFGGTTNAYPALKRDGTNLEARYADDSGYCNFYGRAIFASLALYTDSTRDIYWASRARMRSPADGTIQLTDNAGTDFGLLQFGGTTASFPALKRVGSTLQVRLADDSGRTTIQAGLVAAVDSILMGASSTTHARLVPTGTDSKGNIRLSNTSDDDFGLLQFGGTTSPYPALKRVGNALVCVLASDTANADFGANNLVASSSAYHGWTSRSRIYSSADGAIELRDLGNSYNATLTAGETLLEGPPLTVSDTDQYGLFVRRTLNDPTSETGTQEFNLIKADLSITDDTGWDTVRLMNLQVDGVTQLTVGTTGGLTCGPIWSAGNVQAGGVSRVGVQGRSCFFSDVDGNIRLSNNAGTDFGFLQFGGTTSAFPALERNGANLNLRAADDSVFTSLSLLNLFGFGIVQCGTASQFQWGANSRMWSDADGNIRLNDSAGTDFGLLQFGGTTSSFPAIGRDVSDTDAVAVRLADDSAYATIYAGPMISSGRVQVAANSYLQWSTRSRIWSDVDGNVRLTDIAGTDFSLLQFGGTSASFPALKRSTTWLQLRLADDSGWASLQAGAVIASAYIDAGATTSFRWGTRSRMWSDADGDIRLTDAAGTDFGMLQLGGTTSAFPALQRSNDALRARLADDSADAVVLAKQFWATTFGVKMPGSAGLEFTSRSRIFSYTDGDITLTDTAGTDFTMLQFGGTTSSFPALKRSSTNLLARLADDSDFCAITAKNLNAADYITLGGTQYLQWSGRTQLTAPTDGDLLLRNAAGDDFSMLQLGGTTNAFPAIKRVSGSINFRTADDSSYVTIYANTVIAAGYVRAGTFQYHGWATRSRMYSDADGDIRLTDDAGTDFGLLQFGGTTSSFPALKRVGTSLVAQRADDTGRTGFNCNALDAYAALINATWSSATSLDTPLSVTPTLNDPTGPATGNNFAAIHVDATLTDTSGWENVYLMDLRADGFRKMTVGTDGAVTTEAYLNLAEQASSPSDVSGYGKIFARSSDSALIYRTDTGTEYDLTQSAGVSGGGAAGRIAVWTGASDLGDDADFLWNSATNQLTLAGITLETAQGGIKQTVPTITSAGADDFGLMVTQTLNDASTDVGTQVYRLIKGDMNVTDDTGWDQTYLLDLMVDGVSKFQVLPTGSFVTTSAILNSGGVLSFQTRSRISSQADGEVLLTDNAATDFGLLQFGGTTSSFPAWKRSGTDFHARLADDSGYCDIRADIVTGNNGVISSGPLRAGQTSTISWETRSRMRSSADGDVLLENQAGTDFGLLQFGGTTASFPAWKRDGTSLEARLADDSARTAILANSLGVSTTVSAGVNSFFNWPARSRLYSDADGNIRLTDTAGTDFGLLQFGGTSSSFYALKHHANGLQCRLADDSSWGQFFCGTLTAQYGIRSGETYAHRWGETRSQMHSDADGNIRLTDAAGTDFGLLQFGGTTNAYPALKRVGGVLQARTADDTSFAGFYAAATTLVLPTLTSAGTDDYALSIAQTLNDPVVDAGKTYRMIDADLTITDATGWDNVYLMDLQVGGATRFSIRDTGLGYFDAGLGLKNTSLITWQNRTRLASQADGDLLLRYYASDDFNLLQFGGVSASYPAIGPDPLDSASLAVRKADDSGYANLDAGDITCQGVFITTQSGGAFRFLSRSRVTSPADGNLLLIDNAGTSFGLLQFGGTTNAFPAIRRVGAYLETRLADNSDYCSLNTGGILAATNIGVAAASAFYWNARTQMRASADGNLLLTDSATTDFGRLQFGGTTSAYPAIARHATDTDAFDFVRADGSAKAVIYCHSVQVQPNELLYWQGRSWLQSPADGNLLLTYSTGTDFGLLQFGGTTSSFPALKRNGAVLQCRNADDVGFANFQANGFSAVTEVLAGSGAGGYFGWQTKSRMYSDVDGDIRLTDVAGTDFGLLQFGGTTSSFPAWKRNGAILEARAADDSGQTQVLASQFLATTHIRVGASSAYYWSARSRMYSDADGDIRLTDDAGTDFGTLVFGQATSTFPALQRSGNTLVVKRADGLANTTLRASTITVDGAGRYLWDGRTRMLSGVDGNLLLVDSVETSFGLLQLGGTTSSFPALKRSTTELHARLADDSAFANFRVQNLYAGSGVRAGAGGNIYWDGRSAMQSSTNGYIELYNAAINDFTMLRFGGTTAGFPGLKRSTTELQARLADDSDYTNFSAERFFAQVGCRVEATGTFYWNGRSALYSTSAGVIENQDGAGGVGAIQTARVVEANTAGSASPNALTDLESYKVLTNEAATETNYHALPPAAAGIQYTFCVQDADDIRVVAQTGDTIRIGSSVSTSGGYAESTAIGDCITVVAINSTEWFAIHVVGTWTTG